MVEVCVEAAAGRVPVIAGCGSNDTRGRDPQHAGREGTRRRRRARRPALLQPPQSGGPGRPFQGADRSLRPADPRLQRAVAHRDRHPSRNAGRRWRRCPTWSASRTRTAISTGWPSSAASAAPTSSSSPAMTAPRSASTPWAGRAASRSPPTSRRACAPISRTPAPTAAGQDALALQDRLHPLHARFVLRRLARPRQICPRQGPPRFRLGDPPADDDAERGEPQGGGCGTGACGVDLNHTVRPDGQVAMPPAWLRMTGGHPHLTIVEGLSFPT